MDGKKKDGRHKLFNRAYDKAAAGMGLTEAEDRELRRYIYARPFKIVPCQVCKHETHDKDRDGKPFFLPKGIRMCGPCCYRKTDFWT